MTDSLRDRIVQTLSEHWSAYGYDCTCGWRFDSGGALTDEWEQHVRRCANR